ncbi:luciferase oxidoreductase [Streptomyces sp. NRRL F-4489]|uniref:MsnO8 family LLM class oxidoreductase n=1 Tax=Streptomyces sp. NRRL F-4489 TaxID=1609095 RepID=UPI00074A506C|nr:MsnO8 family LLM class oxidoreductase [Streptomyces sp. NRRL F-4489]KUL54653.1 luciferase oxidoreductase [Streptomyces sp. NRRL F-4489]
MSSQIRTPQFSILDRSRTREGHPPAAALRDTVELARHAERLGYHRFWVSEHHGVPGVAGSAPTVLAAAVASATSAIRVGTGGVMLPNHRPLVVAEQFGVLESLFPGRIDMGLGRSVGFTGGIRKALGAEKDAAGDFEARLAELLGYFTGTQTAHPQVHARPAEGLAVPAFVLATGAGAEVAARAGLALVIGDFRDPAKVLAAVDGYRAAFRPSAMWPRPYVVISGTVAVAGSQEAARRLLVPEARALAYSRTHGVFPPLRPAPDGAGPADGGEGMSARERGFYEEALRGHVHGTEEQVAAALDELIRASAADEVLVTTSGYDRAALLESFERLARVAGLARRG